MHGRFLSMDEVVRTSIKSVRKAAMKYNTKYDTNHLGYPLREVVLDFGCTFNMLRSQDIEPALQDAVRKLSFSPAVSRVADKVLDALS